MDIIGVFNIYLNIMKHLTMMNGGEKAIQNGLHAKLQSRFSVDIANLESLWMIGITTFH